MSNATQMITRIRPLWQKSLATMLTTPEELWAYLQLDPKYLSAANDAAKLFPLRVTKSYLQRIKKGDINDPLLRQILPLDAENATVANYVKDPLAEVNAATNPIQGLLHKYSSRVLLTVTGACAIHCRYCFRRHFPYNENTPGKAGWQKALDYIAQDKKIEEVILSGGDPLTATDEYLKYLIDEIAKISHIKRLRIHTRIPIVLPERIDSAFLQWFASINLKTIIVLHTNHSNEIDDDVAKALFALKQLGVTLLNQSVLLRGVNDNVAALKNLSEKLFSCDVLPYYLHLLDKVAGAAHFSVPTDEAVKLMQEFQSTTSGFLVPKLVREISGELSKTIIL